MQGFGETECERLIYILQQDDRRSTDFTTHILRDRLPQTPSANAPHIRERRPDYLGNYGDG
jgi:hypothetical protein